MYFIFAMQKLKLLRQFGFQPKGFLWQDVFYFCDAKT